MINELIKHIQSLNAKTAAWVAEDSANRWAGMLCEEAEHWTSQGIDSVESFEHYMLVTEVYEGTRDVYGFKPHWGQVNAMSTAELQKELVNLSKEAAAQREDEQREENYLREEQRKHENAVRKALTPKTFAIGDLFPSLA